MLTIHDFPTHHSFMQMLQKVSDQTGKTMDMVAEELMRDWRFCAPRMDDLAIACIDPEDPDAALAPDFKFKYRRQWWTRIVSDACDGLYRHVAGLPGGYSRVAVILPLQEGKTLHVAQLLPASLLGRLPTLRIGSFGYKQEFAKRSIIHTGALIRCKRYQDIYPGVYVGLHKQIPLKQRMALEKSLPDTQEMFSISYQGKIVNRQVLPESRGNVAWKCGGSYISGSWPTPPNGLSLDVLILDDPYRDWGDVESKAYNQCLWDAYMGTLSQRLQTGNSAIISCFTPWTNDDIFVRILEQWRKEGHKVKIIKFPAWGREDTEEEIRLGIDRSYDTRKRHVYKENEEGKFERTEWGEVLTPWKDQLFNEEGISHYEQKKQLPQRERFALYELAPRHQDVDRFPVHWWKFFNPALTHFSIPTVLLSLDANAASENQQSTSKHSFAVCGVWCAYQGNYYRLDEYRARPHYGQLVQDLTKFANKWKDFGMYFLLEEAGHGRALGGDPMFLNVMQEMGYQVVLTKQEERRGRLPKGWSRMSKEEHWSMAEVPIQQGRVFLPTTSYAPITHNWVHTSSEDGRSIGERLGFVEECQQGNHPNDRIDEMAQAICYLQHRDNGISWVDVACELGVMNRSVA